MKTPARLPTQSQPISSSPWRERLLWRPAKINSPDILRLIDVTLKSNESVIDAVIDRPGRDAYYESVEQIYPRWRGPIDVSTPHHQQFQQEIIRNLSNLKKRYMWRQSGAMVYDMHPGLVALLTRSTGRFARLPTSILQDLPCINPLMTFPDPAPQLTLTDGRIGLLRAAFITGGVFHDDKGGFRRLAYTNEPDRNGLIGMMHIDIPDDDGVIEETEISTITMLMPGKATIGDVVERVTELFDGGVTSVPELVPVHVQSFVAQATELLLTCLAYACSRNADITRVASKKGSGKKRKSPQPRDAGDVRKVGYTIGPELGVVRERGPAGPKGDGGGWHQPVHTRGLHQHLYWTGKGRTIPEFKIILPFLAGGKGGDAIPRIRPVKAKPGDPLLEDMNVSTESL